MAERTDVTEILQTASRGSRTAADRLLELLYNDLRRLASSYLRDERSDHTLQPTELVHEAYLRLIDQQRVDWQNRAHFFALAAQVMRRLLVDHARRRGRVKRGGGAARVTLDEDLAPVPGRPRTDILSVDQALTKLAEEHPEKARVVELQFFGGLSAEETATVMEVSKRTVERYGLYARTWLYRHLQTPSATSDA